jgi:hypothetical protein
MRRWLRAKRDLIETVIGMLADQFTLETTRARSLWGQVHQFHGRFLAEQSIARFEHLP